MDTKHAPHALTSLLRQKIAREAREPPVASRAPPRRLQQPPSSDCWLCSQVPQAIGQTVRLVSPNYPSESECPVLCAPCFLTTYLAARILFPLVHDADVIAPLAAAMDERAIALQRSPTKGMKATVSKEDLKQPTAPPHVGFVNSYSLRSFVRLEDPASAASSPLSPQGTTLAPSAVHKGRQPTNTSERTTASLLEWDCPLCTLQNNAASPFVCLACGSRNPDTLSCPGCSLDIHPLLLLEGKQPAACAPVPRAAPTASTTKRASWCAPPLLFDVDSDASFQFVSGAVGKGLFDPVATGTALQPMTHQLWICDVCTLMNARATRRCDMCRAMRRIVCGRCTFVNTLEEKNDSRSASSAMEPMVACEMCAASIRVPLVDARLLERLSHDAAAARLRSSEELSEARRCDAIVEGAQRLRERVECGLKGFIKKQLGDGNCLFRGIADELFGMPQLHPVVRHLITRYMTHNADAYMHYFEDHDQWASYLAQLAQDGTWGDELCIHAATVVFHADITVVSSTEAYWYQQFAAPTASTDSMDAPSPSNATPRIFLAYTSPVHFDSIRLSKSHCSTPPAFALMHKMLQALEVALTEERQWTDAGEVIANLNGAVTETVVDAPTGVQQYAALRAQQQDPLPPPAFLDEWDMVAHQ